MTTRTHARRLPSVCPAIGRKFAMSLFLFLITGVVAFANSPGHAIAATTCVPVSFGVEECTETIVLGSQTYWVITEGVQACRKGNSWNLAEQKITTRETRQSTDYHMIMTTYAFGQVSSVEEWAETVDILVSAETISVGKCIKVKA